MLPVVLHQQHHQETIPSPTRPLQLTARELVTCADVQVVEWQVCWTPTEVVPGGRGPLSAVSVRSARSRWNTPFAANGFSSSPAATSLTKHVFTNISRSSSPSTAPPVTRHWVWIPAEEEMCWILVRNSKLVRTPIPEADRSFPLQKS